MIGHLYLGRYALGPIAARRPCAPQSWTPQRAEPARAPRRTGRPKLWVVGWDRERRS